MDRVGFRRKYEVNAVCEFCQIAKLAAEEHPQDMELAKTAKRIQLTALMLLSSEKSDLSKGARIIQDRQYDCRNCERQSVDGELLPYCKHDKDHECIYQTAAHKAHTIERQLGKGIIQYIAGYFELNYGGRP